MLLNFEYTNINLFGFTIFEPVTILTNLLVIIYGILVFNKLSSKSHVLLKTWSMFFLLMSVSATFGSISHGVHEQLGETFLKIMWFLMNAFSLISIYYFYKAAFGYYHIDKQNVKRWVDIVVVLWILGLLVATLIMNNFLLIKIHAGIVLVYSLGVHFVTYKRNQAGSGYIVSGILIAFLSIIVHSMKISLTEWMNYKDIAHIIMLLSMIYLFKGVQETSANRLQLREQLPQSDNLVF